MLIQRIIFVAFLTTSIFAGIGVDAAQKSVKTSKNAQSGAHQTIVFFGSESPIFLQIHLQVDGRNFDEWFASFLFQAVDTNRDGAITKMEMD